MSWKKGECKKQGCSKMVMSLGRRQKKTEKEYDRDGFLVRKKLKKVPYYSTYCRRHQKAYNRGASCRCLSRSNKLFSCAIMYE